MFEWFTINKVKILSISTFFVILTPIVNCGIRTGEVSQALIEQTKINDSQTLLLQVHTESIAACKTDFLLVMNDVQEKVNEKIESVRDELREDIKRSEDKAEKRADKLEESIKTYQEENKRQNEDIYKLLRDIQRNKD